MVHKNIPNLPYLHRIRYNPDFAIYRPMNKSTINDQLTGIEFQRYSRQLALSEVGIDGQMRLKKAKVLCIGAGGLASPALLYLAAAGVGTLGVVEDDQVELSNLQRQILYTANDVGSHKGQCAKKHLNSLNPGIKINLYPHRLSKDNAIDILSPYDIILDCTDNFHSRFLINDACFYLNKPDIYASILRFEGQCTVFSPPINPCYRCLFKTAPPPELVPNCAEAGVIGALPGLLGAIQAMEVIKLILQQGSSLIGRLLIIDVLTMRFRELTISKNPDCPLCVHKIPFTLLDMPERKNDASLAVSVNEISVHDLLSLQQRKEKIFLLDVREPYEYKICNLGGCLIPLKELSERINELDVKQHIVVYCKTGGRSKKAVAFLKTRGFSKVSSLKGGILKWIQEIDSK